MCARSSADISAQVTGGGQHINSCNISHHSGGAAYCDPLLVFGVLSLFIKAEHSERRHGTSAHRYAWRISDVAMCPVTCETNTKPEIRYRQSVSHDTMRWLGRISWRTFYLLVARSQLHACLAWETFLDLYCT